MRRCRSTRRAAPLESVAPLARAPPRRSRWRTRAEPVSISISSPVSASSTVERPTSGSSRSRGSLTCSATTIVPPPHAPQRAPQRRHRRRRIARALKIREHEHHRAPLGHRVDELERARRRRCRGARGRQLSTSRTSREHMLATFARRHEAPRSDPRRARGRRLSLLRTADSASTQAISASISRLRALAEPKSPEALTSTASRMRELALLAVLLDERVAGARGDVPVDGAHLVAGHVLAHLVEVHAAAAKHRVKAAGERVGGEAPRANVDAPHLASRSL